MSTFKMNFDFSSSEQKNILSILQDKSYSLLGFKAAKGSGKLSTGVPTWFSLPFSQLFGEIEIDYTPKYKVYVFDKADIAAFTTIKMQSLSNEIELGRGLIFEKDGSFSTSSDVQVKSDSIMLTNGRPVGSPNITVGLAGHVNLPGGKEDYLPFCAFELNPQASISMTPLEKICLFAARLSISSGNVQASIASPGCTFSFSDSCENYNLEIEDSSYEIKSAYRGLPVTRVNSGETLSKLLSY